MALAYLSRNIDVVAGRLDGYHHRNNSAALGGEILQVGVMTSWKCQNNIP